MLDFLIKAKAKEKRLAFWVMLITCFCLFVGLISVFVFGQKNIAQSADPPMTISFQGKLLDGSLLATTTKNITFNFYEISSEGSAIFSTSTTVTPSQGLFTVDIITDSGLFAGNSTLYLEVEVEGEVLTPRKLVASSPYAINARFLSGFGTSVVSSTSYIPISNIFGAFQFNTTTFNKDVTMGGDMFHFDSINRNIGINTTTPADIFHVVYDSGAQARFGFDASNYLKITIDENDSVLMATDYMSFQVAGGTTAARFDTMGRFGIGINDPTSILHVVSTTEQFRLGYDSDTYISFQLNDLGLLRINGDTLNIDQGGSKVSVNVAGGPGLYDFEVGGTGRFKGLLSVGGNDNDQAWIGIGTANPQAALHVVSTTEQLRLERSSGVYAAFLVGADGGLQITSDAAAENIFYSNLIVHATSTNNSYLLVNTSTQDGLSSAYSMVVWQPSVGTSALGVNGDIVYSGSLSNTSLDLAENYPLNSQCLSAGDCAEPGDVVCVDSFLESGVKKCSTKEATVLIGIISTKPSIQLGARDLYGEPSVPEPNRPVALAGRVPTKVSVAKGVISAGDRLTYSDMPGVAVKATEDEPTVGIALENFDKPDIAKIVVFVDLDQNNNLNGDFDELSVELKDDQIVRKEGDIDLAGHTLWGVKAIMGMNNKWKIDEQGNLVKTVATDKGNKDVYGLYSENKEEVILSGHNHLTNGEKLILLSESDRLAIDANDGFKVFLTTAGDSNGIYVAHQDFASFYVKENNGGKSNVEFDWMIVAKIRGENFTQKLPIEDGASSNTSTTSTNTTSTITTSTTGLELPDDQPDSGDDDGQNGNNATSTIVDASGAGQGDSNTGTVSSTVNINLDTTEEGEKDDQAVEEPPA